MMQHTQTGLIAAFAFLAACSARDRPAADSDEPPGTDGTAVVADAFGAEEDPLTPEQLEEGRLDSLWRQYARLDTEGSSSFHPTGTEGIAADERAVIGPLGGQPTGPADSVGPDSLCPDSLGPDSAASQTAALSVAGPATWDRIDPATVNARPASFPIHGDAEGPDVARIQILLDQVHFSPGVIDGRWGKNTEIAVYWFQRANGLEATGDVDEETLAALTRRAGSTQVRPYTLTEQDVAGPFTELPEDVYERAAMECLCYTSREEKLAEMFHTTPALLQQLNPGMTLDAVEAGETLEVPAVAPFHASDLPQGSYPGGGEVKRLVISDGGHYVHAFAADGSLLYHFPSTLGSEYAPSPVGEFRVSSITFDPRWLYQPGLLTGEDPTKKNALLPAGPNSPVGVVWIQLSKPHYGIHGTAAPETIGYATSHGCVRLTNWDAAFLALRLAPGAEVHFRDVSSRQ